MTRDHVPYAPALALAFALVASGCTDATPPAPAAPDAHAAADAADAHGHDAVGASAGIDFPVPADHVPWTPDAPLVEGMSRVRAAIAGLEGAPDESTVRSHAGAVDGAVDYMFANCDLPTEPDVALHAILARLMAGSRDLQAHPESLAPVADMHAALRNYEALFDDPNG